MELETGIKIGRLLSWAADSYPDTVSGSVKTYFPPEIFDRSSHPLVTAAFHRLLQLTSAISFADLVFKASPFHDRPLVNVFPIRSL